MNRIVAAPGLGVPASRSPGRIFLAATALSVAGSAAGVLGATGATTIAGQLRDGAIYTGCFLALMLLASGLAVPFVPVLTARVGVTRALVIAKTLTAASWFLVGVALLLGAPAFPTLMFAAPLFGTLTAFGGVLQPIATKCYLATSQMSRAYARLSVVTGLAWGFGALAGGLFLNLGSPGWGLVINGILTVPLCLVLRYVRPPVRPALPARQPGAVRNIARTLRANRQLRNTTILGSAVGIFVAPMGSLVVPLSQALRQEPLYRGAGLLMAGMALGQVLSPRLVHRLSRHRNDLGSSAIAALSVGVVLAVFALCSLLVTRQFELALWMLLSIAYGMTRFASRSLTIGSAAESDSEDRATTSLAVLFFVAGFTAPIGMLIWSVLIGSVSAESALLFGAVGITLVSAPIFLASRREAAA